MLAVLKRQSVGILCSTFRGVVKQWKHAVGDSIYFHQLFCLVFDLCNQWRLSSQTADCCPSTHSSWVANTGILDIPCRLFKQILYMCHAKKAPLTITIVYYFQYLDPGWGSQDHWKIKAVDCLFLYTFQLIWMKFDVMLKQFTFFKSWNNCWIRFSDSREVTVVLLTTSENLNVGMPVDLC